MHVWLVTQAFVQIVIPLNSISLRLVLEVNVMYCIGSTMSKATIGCDDDDDSSI